MAEIPFSIHQLFGCDAVCLFCFRVSRTPTLPYPTRAWQRYHFSWSGIVWYGSMTKSPTCPTEALGIPFHCWGAAESNEKYRDMIMGNNNVDHMYCSIEDMLHSVACSKHATATARAQCQCCPEGASPRLGVTGSPCNPYSVRRAKRFVDGSISEHSMNKTTMESVIQFYQTFEPHTGVTEQVAGFLKRTSDVDPESPCEKCLE